MRLWLRPHAGPRDEAATRKKMIGSLRGSNCTTAARGKTTVPSSQRQSTRRTPFTRASLAATVGVPCASGCSIQIPRYPGKSAYVRLRLRALAWERYRLLPAIVA